MKLWGGRFTKSTDSFTDHFHSSISFDQRMYKEDITGSIAHAAMLGKQGVISMEDSELLQKTLKELLADIEAGKVEFDEKAEDIHMNIETLLIERIGDVGKRLHTGRSRNDQVALDIRMYNREQIKDIKALLLELIEALNTIAENNVNPLRWLTMSLPTVKCSKGMWTGSATHTDAQASCLWVPALSLPRPTPLTARPYATPSVLTALHWTAWTAFPTGISV